MEYITLMIEVENIFKSELDKNFLRNGISNSKIDIQITINVLYSEIMALGYNSGNVEKTFYNLQNENSEILGNHVYKNLLETSKKYKKHIKIFSAFHLELKNGIDYKTLLENLNKRLIIK